MSDKPGVGVMIQQLFGDRGDVEKVKAFVGKKITSVSLTDASLTLGFEGGAVRFWDDGQSCCEHRYMTADGDDLSYWVGAEFMDAETREASAEYMGALKREPYDEAHEVEFLIVTTSRGAFTIASHNEHNGYYGGFWIKVEVLNVA